MTICDMGCGNGFYSLKMAKLVGARGRVLAVDIQTEMLALLRSRAEAEGIDNVVTLSTFRNPEFGRDYGVVMTSGPLRGLMSRSVVILDETGTVVYREQVPEIAQEPDYQGALAALS